MLHGGQHPVIGVRGDVAPAAVEDAGHGLPRDAGVAGAADDSDAAFPYRFRNAAVGSAVLHGPPFAGFPPAYRGWWRPSEVDRQPAPGSLDDPRNRVETPWNVQPVERSTWGR